MRGKIIGRLPDGLVAPERTHVLDQEIEVDCGRMIEVLLYSLFKREMAAIFVVRILRQQKSLVRAERLRKPFSHRRFS
jgi:hypothetical protein